MKYTHCEKGGLSYGLPVAASVLFGFLFDPPGNARFSHVQGVGNHIGVIADTVDDGLRAELLKFVTGKRLAFITAPDAVQLFLYGMCAFGLCAVVVGSCSAVKSLCRKFLKRGKIHDSK